MGRPGTPVSPTALDISPVGSVVGLALVGDTVIGGAATVYNPGRSPFPPLDGFVVAKLPFPMVVGVSPGVGAEGVPVSTPLRVELNRTVTGVSNQTVRLVLVDGTAQGTNVPLTVSTAGRTVELAPQAALSTSATYRIEIDGLSDSVSGAAFPAPFISTFTTASASTAISMSLSSIAPREGGVTGGTLVTLTGTGFVAGSEVRVGGALAAVQSVAADGTSLSFLTPPGAAGLNTVSVASPQGTRIRRIGGFLYVEPLRLVAVSPGVGATSGGTSVVLTGRGFATTGSVQVRFGTQPALSVRVIGTGVVEAVTPNGAVGVVDVTVENPDGATSTLARAWEYQAPAQSLVSLGADRVHDVLVLGDTAYAATRNGLSVIDLSGLERFGANAGQPISPSDRNHAIDRNNDGVDDRLLASIAGGELTALAHNGGSRVWASQARFNQLLASPPFWSGAVSAFDVTFTNVGTRDDVSIASAVGVDLPDGGFGISRRGDEVLAAGGDGLIRYDVTGTPFPVDGLNPGGAAQGLAVGSGFALVPTGVRDPSTWRLSNGRLVRVGTSGKLAKTGELTLEAQKVRLSGSTAIVAAGSQGLVLVDAAATPMVVLSSLSLGGFARDVNLMGDLAYVAVEGVGVVVVDISNRALPERLSVIGGGSATAVAIGNGRVVSVRTGAGGAQLSFGPVNDFALIGSSVARGTVVPLDLASVTLTFSTALDASTAAQAFSITADGQPVSGTLEAGGAQASSTLLYRLTGPLPADAEVRVQVTTSLRSLGGANLSRPVDLRFRSAPAAGPTPSISQVSPRVGPVAGGTQVDILGSDFSPNAVVRIGDAPAQVVATGSTRLRVVSPPGVAGLADVVVVNGSGLEGRRVGGFLYRAPLRLDAASPAFLNPRGGSVLTFRGAGLLPPWLEPSGTLRIRVGGLDATSVSWRSTESLTAVAPANSYGSVSVQVSTGDGSEQFTMPQRPTYGLPFVAEELTASMAPRSLVADETTPGLLHAAAGPTTSNFFPQPYFGPLTSSGTIRESFRSASFDVVLPGRPRLQAAFPVLATNSQADESVWAIARGKTPPAGTEFAPDSLDIAFQQGRLYVANGESGLSVMSGQTDGGITGLFVSLKGRHVPETPFVTRALPVGAGAWALTSTWQKIQPRPPPNGCAPAVPAVSTGGRVLYVDSRVETDPVEAGSLVVGGGTPVAVATWRDRMVVAEGHLAGVGFTQCGETPFPPPPLFSLQGPRTMFRAELATTPGEGAPPSDPTSTLSFFDSQAPTAQRLGTFTVPFNISDVVMNGDTAIIAAPTVGLVFVDASNPAAPSEIARVAFDTELSNAPGTPLRMKLFANTLFVAAGAGGVVMVDVTDPRNPKVLSAGNTEPALDIIPFQDRMYLASGRGLTELAMPFSFVRGVSPARGAKVPPSAAPVVVRLSRPVSETSVTSSSVRLVGPQGDVPVDLTVNNDFTRQSFEIRLTPRQALAPETNWTVQLTASVADQRGGALLVPFSSEFTTATAGARQPVLAGVSPTFLPVEGGSIVVSGAELGQVSSVRLGGVSVTPSASSATSLTVTVGSRDAGFYDLAVQDSSGLAAVLPVAIQLVEPIAGRATATPDHGPVEGGTRVTVTLNGRQALVAGSSVFVGGQAAVEVDVQSPTTVSFTIPASTGPGIVPIALARPGESSVSVATFSYEGPVGVKVDLPGFPPRVVSELDVSGSNWFIGSREGPPGLEVFDVSVPERPIRLGGVTSTAPVRGVDVEGQVAFIAQEEFGVGVLSIADPAQPYEVGRLVSGGLTTDVQVAGSDLWVSTVDPSALSGSVRRLAAFEPGFTPLSVLALDADPLSIDVAEGRLFALTTDVTTSNAARSATALELRVYDFAGTRVGRVVVEAGLSSYEQRVKSRLSVRGGRAWVTSGNRIFVFDVSSPASPSLLRSSDVGSSASGVTLVGGTAWAGLESSTSGTTLQGIPPTELLVTRLSPESGSVVAPDAVVTAELTLPAAEPSVTASTFSVLVNGQAVAGERRVEFTTTGANLIFTAQGGFSPGDVVQVRVDGITGFDARPLARAATSTFTVGGAGALQPTISALVPAVGFVDATTTVVIRGSGFRTGTVARVGGLPCAVIGSTATELTVAVPPSPAFFAGPALVEVEDPAGPVARRAGGFLYVERLRLVSLSPDSAPQRGGVSVNLTGRGFRPGLVVDFGGTASFSVVAASTTQAVAVAPPHGPGRVDVTASLAGQAATASGAFLYGSGAVAEFRVGAVSDVTIDNGVAFAALGATSDIVGRDGTVYRTGVTSQSKGIAIIDLSEPNALRTVKVLSLTSAVRRVKKAGTKLYAAAGGDGLLELDVSLPASAAVVRSRALQGARDVVVADGLAFVADDSGVAIVDLSRFVVAGRIAISGGANAVTLRRGQLVVGTASVAAPEVRVYDVRNANWAELGRVSLSAPAQHLSVESARVFASLGRARQVAIIDITNPASPAPAGTIQLVDALGAGWVSAEQTLVVGDAVQVAAGGGDIQRFTAPIGQSPQYVDTAAVFGDVRAIGFEGRNAFAGTLFLDDGDARELPVATAADANGTLVGALSTIALDFIHVRGATPRGGAVVALATAPEVSISELPETSTLTALTLETAGGVSVPVVRSVVAEPRGARITLTPSTPLLPSATYTIESAPTLRGLSQATLGLTWRSSFSTASTAATERPTIASASPPAGLVTGGDSLDIIGEDFVPGVRVEVGGATAQVLSVSADGRRVTVLVPAGPRGLAAIEVTNPNGLGSLVLGAFRYLVAPRIDSISPSVAEFDSRSTVTVVGDGLHAQSLVTFGGVPVRSVTVNDDDSLSVVVPDGVTGVVDVSVSTSSAQGSVSATRPQGFTFQLRRQRLTSGSFGPSVKTGSALLVAEGSQLVPFDVSLPEQPLRHSSVAGVNSANAMAIVGRELFVAGLGEVVRYDLDTCGTAPGALCLPQELQRIALSPAVQLSAIAARNGAAYVAVSGSNEVVLLGRVASRWEIVGSTTLSTGTVSDIALTDDALVVAVQASGAGRIEVRDFASPTLPLVATVPGLPSSVPALSVDGRRLAVATGDGARLIDLSNRAAPVQVAAWAAPSNPPTAIKLAGPFVLAADFSRVWLLDTTQGLTARTWGVVSGTPRAIELVDGAVMLTSNSGLATYQLPYPSLRSVSTAVRPNEALFAEFPSTTSGVVLSGATIAATRLGNAVVGSSVLQGGRWSFTPSSPLTAGDLLTLRVTAPSWPALGGNWLGAFTAPVRVEAATNGLSALSVSPTFGPVSGGTNVVIDGTGFEATTEVRIAGVVVPVLPGWTSTRLEVVTPQVASAGPAVVEVRNASGAAFEVPTGFSFIAPLAITGVTPSVVPEQGALVAITGSGFTRGLTIRLGGALVVPQAFSPTSVQVVVPAGPSGDVAVELSSAGAAPVTRTGVLRRADSLAPALVALSPVDEDGVDNVRLQPVFVARFSEPLDPASFATAQLVATTSGQTVPASTAAGADSSSFTITPLAALTSTTHYRLTLSQVRDASGNAAGLSATREFRTRDLVAPQASVVLANDGRLVTNGLQLAANVPWRLQVAATDDSGNVSTTLTADGVAATREPNSNVFGFTWPLSAVGTTSTIVATARDASQNVTTLTFSVVITNDTPPTVTFGAPVAGLTVEEGATLPISVVATDNNGVSVVRLFVDGRPWKTVSGSTTTVTLTDSLRVGPASTPRVMQLTAEAIDSRGTRGLSAPVDVTVSPDVTAPVVSFLSPATGLQFRGGSKLPLRLSVQESNELTQVVFRADGVVVATRNAAPWTATYLAPNPASAQSVTLTAEARDARGNVGNASSGITLTTQTAAPVVSIAAPVPDGFGFDEGSTVPVQLLVTDAEQVVDMSVQFGGVTRSFSSTPAVLTFSMAAPQVTPPADFAGTYQQSEPFIVTWRDSAGLTKTARSTVTVRDVTALPVRLVVTQTPAPPVVLGGGLLVAQAVVDAGVTLSRSNVDSTSLSVAGVAVGAQSSNRFQLPLGPEGASVELRGGAEATVFSNGTTYRLTAGASSSLRVFAGTPVVTPLAARGAAVSIEQDGDRVVVVRAVPGGFTSIESLSLAGASLAQRRFGGVPVAAGVWRGRVWVAVRTGASDSLRSFDSQTLGDGVQTTVRSFVTSLEGRGDALYVGTDEGLEVRDESGALSSRIALDGIRSLSTARGTLYVATRSRVLAYDLARFGTPVLRQSLVASGVERVAATSAGVCVAGSRLECFDTQLNSRGSVALSGPAQSLRALGPWLAASSASGTLIYDISQAPMEQGLFDATGVLGLSASGLRSVGGRGLTTWPLIRGTTPPQVSLGAPSNAVAGSMMALTSVVNDGADPFNAYTAELRLGGVTVERFDSQVPAEVRLPAVAGSVTLELLVRDVGGQSVTATATVVTSTPVAAPAVSLVAPTEGVSGGRLPVRVETSQPGNLTAVEYAVDGVPTLVNSSGFVSTLVLPVVSSDSSVSVSATGIDAQGRRGPVSSATVLVRAMPVVLPVVTPALVGASPFIEGTIRTVRITATPALAPTDVVRVSVDGLSAGDAVAPDYELSVRLPQVTGSRSVSIEATPVDSAGREGAAAATTVVVVDDLNVPSVTLAVSPPGAFVPRGSALDATVAVSDASLVTVTSSLRIDGVEVATDGAQLSFVVPLTTPVGAIIEVRATATDAQGNVVSTTAQRRVTTQAVSTVSTSTPGAFVPSAGVAAWGDLVALGTPTGAALFRAQATGLTHVADWNVGEAPSAIGLGGGLLLVGRSGGADVVSVTPAGAMAQVGFVPGRWAAFANAGEAFCASELSATPGQFDSRWLDVRDPSAIRVLSGASFTSRLARPEGRLGECLFDWAAGSWHVAYERSARNEPVQTSRLVGTNAPANALARAFLTSTGGVSVGGSTLRSHSTSSAFVDVALPASALDAVLAGENALVTTSDGLLHVVDVRDSARPVLRASVPFAAERMAVTGGLIVGVSSTALELTTLALPTADDASALSTYTTSDLATSVAGLSGNIVIGAGQQGLLRGRFDAPGVSNVLTRAGVATQVQQVGSTIFSMSGSTLNSAYDASGSFFGPTPVPGFSAVSTYSAAHQRLWAISGASLLTAPWRFTSSPAFDVPVSMTLPGAALSLASEEDFAVVASGNSFSIVEVSPSGVPAVTATLSSPATTVAVEGGLLAVAADRSIQLYSVTTPGSPTLLGSVTTAEPARRVRFGGRLLLVAEVGGVETWDVSNAAAPVFRVKYPATRADDAMVLDGFPVVADAPVGVTTFAPVAALTPSVVWRASLPSLVEAGALVSFDVEARGAAIDTLELLVDGTRLGQVGSNGKGTFLVPAGAIPGTFVSVVAQARAAGGRVGSSTTKQLLVTTPSAVASITLTNPNILASGSSFSLSGSFSNLLAPVGASVDLDGVAVSSGQPSLANGQFQIPIVVPVYASTATRTLTVRLVDGRGRGASASVQVSVRGDLTPPSAPTGLPATLKAEPAINLFTVRTSDDAAVRLDLFVDGVLHTSGVGAGGVTLRDVVVRILEAQVGATVTLRALATDASGRTAETSQTYVVQPDGVAPIVTLTTLATVAEGRRFQQAVNAFDSDSDLASLELFVDGVRVLNRASTPTSSLNENVLLTAPLTAAASTMNLEAVGRDRRGRETRVARTIGIVQAPLPVVAFNQTPATALEGDNLYTTNNAWARIDDLSFRATRLEVFLNGTSIGVASRAANEDTVRNLDVNLNVALPLLTQSPTAIFEAVGLDVLGREVRASTTVTLLPNPPPTVTFTRSIAAPLLGDSVTWCVRGEDSDGRSRSGFGMTVAIDGAPQTATSCGTHCREFCTTRTSATAASFVMTASATDVLGKVTTAQDTLTFAANQPPVPSLVAPAQGPEGGSVSVRASANDERGIAWLEVRADGALVQRITPVVVGQQYIVSVPTPTVGTRIITLEAEDVGGLRASTSASVSVVPSAQLGYISESDTSFDDTDLVVSGRELRIDGTHRFSSLTIEDGGVVTHSSQGLTGTKSFDLDITGTLSISADSRIDVSAKGGLGGLVAPNSATQGRTSQNVAGPDDASGSHGGLGQADSVGQPAVGVFSDATFVGGGASSSLEPVRPGTSGGGLARLRAQTAVLNGRILANGGPSVSGSRTGAGGGIRLEVSSLQGTGRIEANGGIGGGGGGGRVVVRYQSISGFDLANIEARGAGQGGVGTVFLEQTTVSADGGVGALGRLRLDNGGTSGGLTTTIPGATLARLDIVRGSSVTFSAPVSASDLSVVDSRATFADALTTPGLSALSVLGSQVTLARAWQPPTGLSLSLTDSTLTASTSGSVNLTEVQLTNSTWTTPAPTLTQTGSIDFAASGVVVVDGLSRLDVSAKGALGGLSGNNFDPAGRTSTGASGEGAAAGSHGGVGAYTAYPPNIATDSAFEPALPGGGGSASASNEVGGNGGGVLRVTAATLSLNGALLANGGTASGAALAGAGGSIRVNVSGTLSGTGRIEAKGGFAATAANGGGGGRVSVQYGTLSGFDLSTVDASSQGQGAGVGTVLTKPSLATNWSLRLDNKGRGSWTWTDVPGGTFASISVVGGSVGSFTAAVTTSVATFSDCNLQWPSFTFLGSTALRIDRCGGVYSNGPFSTPSGLTLVSSWVGAYAGFEPLASLAIQNSQLFVSSGSHLNVVGDVSVDVSSAIETQSNSSRSDTFTANGSGAGWGVGGATPAVTAPAEFALTRPTFEGAPATSDYVDGFPGAAGGALRLTASRLLLDGEIRASAQSGLSNSGAGPTFAGGGGSVLIEVTEALSPNSTGRVSANGASGSGGGRIAIVHAGTDMPTWTLSATGGPEGGGAGTIYVERDDPAAGRVLRFVTLNNGPAGATPVVPLTPVSLPVSSAVDPLETVSVAEGVGADFIGALSTNQLDLAAGVIGRRTRVAFDFVEVNFGFPSSFTSTDVLFRRGELPPMFALLADDSRITLQNNFGISPTIEASVSLTNGSVLEVTRGAASSEATLIVNASDVTVDALSRIDVSGAGHAADTGPGAESGAAGSHGGPGESATSSLEYGDFITGFPYQSGSGGSSDGTLTVPGGAGGGALVINTSTIHLDGVLRANGANGFTGGAGGLVRVSGLFSGAADLFGAGRIEVLGGLPGGGAGRIVINQANNAPLTWDLDASRRSGGGGPGTVFVTSFNSQTIVTTSRLTIDARSVAPPSLLRATTLPSVGGLTVDFLSVLGGAHVETTDFVSAGTTNVDATSSFTSPNLSLP